MHTKEPRAHRRPSRRGIALVTGPTGTPAAPMPRPLPPWWRDENEDEKPKPRFAKDVTRWSLDRLVREVGALARDIIPRPRMRSDWADSGVRWYEMLEQTAARLGAVAEAALSGPSGQIKCYQPCVMISVPPSALPALAQATVALGALNVLADEAYQLATALDEAAEVICAAVDAHMVGIEDGDEFDRAGYGEVDPSEDFPPRDQAFDDTPDWA